MAKKQVTINETAAAASSARAAKPRAPRVKAAQHKVVPAAEPVEAPAVAGHAAAENPHDTIAHIAYSLWEARGEEGGSATEDWFQAEQKYHELITK